MNVLMILASGKSSRFGGFPKAFCKINNEYVAQRTVNLCKDFYEKIFLIINREIYSGYKDKITGCTTLCIETGQGDAHSFLRASRKLMSECNAEHVTLCWGDTVYIDDEVFRKASNVSIDDDTLGYSLCSIDSNPYAWYDTKDEVIVATHFKKDDGTIESGIHDQSVFVFKLKDVCVQLERYMKKIGINDEEDYNENNKMHEMKLLKSFVFFYENDMLPMKILMVDSGKSYSFNTSEELQEIRLKIMIT